MRAARPGAFSCYFGIDTPSKEQLFSCASYSVDEICRNIGTDFGVFKHGRPVEDR